MIRSVAFDMDGVLADFSSGVFKLLGKPKPETFPWEHVPDYAWGMMGRPFWRDLPPIADGFRLYREARSRNLDVFFVTAPPRTHRAEAIVGKLEWMKHWFPEVHEDEIVFTPKKHRLARPDTLLIDDRDENVDSWVAAGGPVIHFPACYNKAKDTCPTTLSLETYHAPTVPAAVDNGHLFSRPHPHCR